MKVLALHPEKCTGCLRCELACSYMQTGDFQPRPVRPVAAIDQFEHKRCHGVDSGIARGNEGDVAAPRGKVEGMDDPLLLRAEREGMLRLARSQRFQQIEIELVADPIACLAQRCIDLRRAAFRSTRAKAENGKPALRPSDRHRVDDPRRNPDSAGGVFAPLLGQCQPPIGTHPCQGGTLGHTMTTCLAENEIGGIGQARRLALERFGIEEARRYVPMGRQRMNRRLRRL